MPELEKKDDKDKGLTLAGDDTGDGSVQSISDDQIYAPEPPTRDNPAESPPDAVGELGGVEGEEPPKPAAGEGDEPPAEAGPGEDITGQEPGEGNPPEEKPKPKDGEDGEGGDDEPPRPVVLWDPDRQRDDQEKANERKALEKRNADLESEVTRLKEQAQATAGKPGASKEDKAAAADLESLESEIQAMDPEDMDTGKLKAMMAKIAKAVKSAKSSDVEAVRQELRELKADRQKEQDDRSKAAERAQATRRNAALNAHIEALDKEHDPSGKLRNEASTLVAKMIADEGYTADRLPDLATAKLMYNEAYRTLAKRGKPAGKGAKKPSGDETPRPGRGSGGPAIPPGTKLKPGSIDEVFDQQMRAGHYRPGKK